MPQVNWCTFEGLPGAVQTNFEVLCRALIRRHYGRHGTFAALANQPGVEFHLKLQTSCSLGEAGRWFGWQCRWYEKLPSGRAIGSARRQKIVEAIRKTEKELPGITDWVLWTRHVLTKGDQKWFASLRTSMRLHQWTFLEVEEHLSGEAEILKGTYFGELVLTPSMLVELHKKAIAPIRSRWQPDVHQVVDAERRLRRGLGEVGSWDSIQEVLARLNADGKAIERDRMGISSQFAEWTEDVIRLTRGIECILMTVQAILIQGDLDFLRQQLDEPIAGPNPAICALPRLLRAARQRAALSVTNGIADVRRALRLLNKIKADLAMRLIAVVAEAGCGKTELAAQLTATQADGRPSGILLHGRELHARHNLNDLAKNVTVLGNPVSSMETLVAAVDAAGQRAGRRIPLVIDGLNEAEDPRDWKSALASVKETLQQYPYVLVICTIRGAFVRDALPDGIEQLQIPGFDHDTSEAVGRYFNYYRIDATDATFPLKLLSHPLTLRLFCEVTNPGRMKIVGVEAMPGSLTALFDRYLDQAAERISELAPRTNRYHQADVRAAISAIGTALWSQKDRSLDMSAIRHQLGDDRRLWNESIIRALEQDGVLIRHSHEEQSGNRVAIIYDALAGHVVADSLLASMGRTKMAEWLKDSATIDALTEASQYQHPLGGDILRALVGLVPRRFFGQQLWPLLLEPLRTRALRRAAELEGAYLDSQTVDNLASLAGQQADLFDRLLCTRAVPSHPLNAEFLDRVLRPMGVAERDYRWTEWVRRTTEWMRPNTDEITDDLRWLEKQWRNLAPRNQADRLRARWTMWLLTSTIRAVRDQATSALYWFGRGDPKALFDLTLDSLSINDPFVPERMLAASYGVAMAYQLPDAGFADSLSAYLAGLRDILSGNTAKSPTDHWLMRLYVQGTISLAESFYPTAAPHYPKSSLAIAFAPGPSVEPIQKNDSRASGVRHTFGDDFENYTLGRLCAGRQNYDMDNAGHRAVMSYVRGVVWAMGWREAELGAIDRNLERSLSRHERPKTERYGKKYGWIGYYNYAGMLDARGQLCHVGRLPDVQIDPSFPIRSRSAPFSLPMWASRPPADDRRWIRSGIVTVPKELMFRTEIGGQPGPWIAVDADLVTTDETRGRKVFGLLVALLVDQADKAELVNELNGRVNPGADFLHEVPADYFTFAGEIPWSSEFARELDGDLPLYAKTVRLTGGSDVEVEILVHRYEWERYHNPLNQAMGEIIPSRSFSATFDLRSGPQSFDQREPSGALASISLEAPSGFEGRLLYLREDLLHKYAVGRELVLLIWGERQLTNWDTRPPWLDRLQDSGRDVWKQIWMGSDFAPRFAKNSRRSKQKPRHR